MTCETHVNEITALIKSYLDAYQHRDIDALAAVVANDDKFVAFGTDESEVWLGWEEFKSASEKLFGAMDEIHWDREKTQRINFSRDGNTAWFVEELTGNFLTGGEKHTCDFRFSCVCEKRDGSWKIVQFHRSVPAEEHAVPYLETHGVRFD
ncbi:MAG: nuclear transport factor 2 family protein [Pseudomonadota bacterium]